MKSKKWLNVFFFAIWVLPHTARGQVDLDIDPGFNQEQVDALRIWNNNVVPVHDRLTVPFPLPKLSIKLSQNGISGGCGTIHLTPTFRPTNKNDVSGGFYHVLTHEYGHAKNCRTLHLGALEEGRVESEADLVFRELARTNKSIKLSTKLWIADALQNLPLNAVAGSSSFYDFGNGYSINLRYQMSAAKFEKLVNKLTGNTFETLDREVLSRYLTENEYYALLDRISGNIDGVMPSTFFQKNTAAFVDGQDGIFYGIYTYKIMQSPTDAGSWLGESTIINPGSAFGFVTERRSGKNRFRSDFGSFWQAQNVFGTTVLSSSNMELSQSASLPAGAYKIVGCAWQENACVPNLRDTNFFVIYKNSWERGKIFVIANGPNFTDLYNQTQLSLVNPPRGVFAENLPGLLVINLNGSRDNITVTDGRRTRTFTPDRDFSQVVFFTERDQPYLYSVTNGASFNNAGAAIGPSQAVVPGSIQTVFVFGATHTDPVQSSALPLPVSSCNGGQGETRVVFVDRNGIETRAPLFYCSQRQVNFQVPGGIGLDKTKICIELNGTKSNCLEIAVAEADPGIFVTNWENLIGAVIFQGGGLVTDQRPAQAGDVLSIYATGLGAVDNSVPDGHPAPNSPLSNTLNVPSVVIDEMEFPATFSGLAPGFVGLYQVNFEVPAGLSPGNHKLALSIRGLSSNWVGLAIH